MASAIRGAHHQERVMSPLRNARLSHFGRRVAARYAMVVMTDRHSHRV